MEENGRIPFTFARKKYLETESGIYPTHVCETMFPSWKILTNFRIREGSSIFLARFPFGWKGFNRHGRMKRMEKGKGRSKGVIELFRDRNFSTRNGGGGKDWTRAIYDGGLSQPPPRSRRFVCRCVNARTSSNAAPE